MLSPTSDTPLIETPGAGEAGYEIQFRDYLDPRWNEWFPGWTITNLENGVVRLVNPKADQSALHGALIKIRDLNLTLISVSRIA